MKPPSLIPPVTKKFPQPEAVKLPRVAGQTGISATPPAGPDDHPVVHRDAASATPYPA